MSAPEPEFQILLVGLNHRTAPTEVREALAYSEEEAAQWARLAVEKEAIDLGGPEIREAAVLSTCNRTEAYVILSPGRPRPAAEMEQRMVRLLAAGRTEVPAADIFYHRAGEDAARHLFRVASGLDSLVQGEAQILGQVHRAHELAVGAGAVGPVLDRLFSTAFRAGKRARSETAIGRGAVSVASAAVELAVKVVGPLEKRTALVVGAGETGRITAQHLASAGPQRLWITNRTLERAEALAAEVGGEARPLESLGELLATADLVVAATFAPTPILTRPMVQAALKRHRRFLVLLDISIPRNVEPAVNDLDGAFLYDMDALQKVVRENLGRREEEIPRVEQILEDELEVYFKWVRSLGAGPLIGRMRDHFEALRQEEVRRHTKGLSAREAEAVDRATRALMNKFLHGPTVHLRNGGGSDPQSIDLLRRIFFGGSREEKELRPGGRTVSPEEEK